VNAFEKNALFLSVNAFRTKVLIRDTIFTSPTGNGTVILRVNPSHVKVQPLAVQREYTIAKVPSYFKTLSIRLTWGILSATFRFAVKPSTD